MENSLEVGSSANQFEAVDNMVKQFRFDDPPADMHLSTAQLNADIEPAAPKPLKQKKLLRKNTIKKENSFMDEEEREENKIKPKKFTSCSSKFYLKRGKKSSSNLKISTQISLKHQATESMECSMNSDLNYDPSSQTCDMNTSNLSSIICLQLFSLIIINHFKPKTLISLVNMISLVVYNFKMHGYLTPRAPPPPPFRRVL